MKGEKLLSELYELTQIEEFERGLSKEEEFRYSELTNMLQNNKVEIPFRIIK